MFMFWAERFFKAYYLRICIFLLFGIRDDIISVIAVTNENQFQFNYFKFYVIQSNKRN